MQFFLDTKYADVILHHILSEFETVYFVSEKKVQKYHYRL